VKLSGIYSRNKYFDTFYLAGSQDLPFLEEDVHVEDAITSTIFESYDEFLADGWPDFIRDYSE